jgi:hypothetical protein
MRQLTCRSYMYPLGDSATTAIFTNTERKSLAAFLNSPTAITELKTHLPWESVQLAADALQRAGLD